MFGHKKRSVYKGKQAHNMFLNSVGHLLSNYVDACVLLMLQARFSVRGIWVNMKRDLQESDTCVISQKNSKYFTLLQSNFCFHMENITYINSVC